MPLLYTSVSINNTILVEYTTPNTTGNFISVANNVLKKLHTSAGSSTVAGDRAKLLSADQQTKNTYVYDNYMFHIVQQYSGSDRLILLCMSTLQYNTTVAYKYLNELQQNLLKQYEIIDLVQFNAYALQSLFEHTIETTQSQYNTTYGNTGDSKLQSINAQVDSVKNVMIENIDSVLARGDKIELLVTKTDMLSEESLKFKKQSKKLKLNYFMKNIRAWVAIALIVLALVYVIVASQCGITLSQC